MLVYVVVNYGNFEVLSSLMNYFLYVELFNFYGNMVLYCVIMLKVDEDVLIWVVQIVISEKGFYKMWVNVDGVLEYDLVVKFQFNVLVCFFFDYSDDVMVVSFDGLLDIIEV